MHKKTNEEKAVFEILKCINPKYGEFTYEQIHKDKPDLQFDKLNEGIEITIAESEHHGRYEAFISENLHKHLSEFEFRKLACKHKISDCWIYAPKGKVIGSSEYDGLSDFKEYKKDVADAIIKKNNKLNKYKIFRTNMLYVICVLSFRKNDIEDILSEAKIIKYDFIYIHCFDTIYIINKNKKIIKILGIEYKNNTPTIKMIE